ncbi:Uncharacterized protein Rs2_39615 [Raphanus sativus]|nr:Uncharacterized protein Rs2_39615 [Raphanus sativus]
MYIENRGRNTLRERESKSESFCLWRPGGASGRVPAPEGTIFSVFRCSLHPQYSCGPPALLSASGERVRRRFQAVFGEVLAFPVVGCLLLESRRGVAVWIVLGLLVCSCV